MKLKKLTSTRRGRVVLAAVPAAAAVTVLMAGVANGAVPVSFSISGQQFQVGASTLEGDHFSQYAGVNQQVGADKDPSKNQAVAISNIEYAELHDLCQSVVTKTPLGTLGLKIEAGGDPKHPATANGLQIGMTDLKGDATFTNIRIGVDASTVQTDAKGAVGGFAQDADHVTITGLQQTAWSTTAATFKLNGLHLYLTDGKTCF